MEVNIVLTSQLCFIKTKEDDECQGLTMVAGHAAGLDKFCGLKEQGTEDPSYWPSQVGQGTNVFVNKNTFENTHVIMGNFYFLLFILQCFQIFYSELVLPL